MKFERKPALRMITLALLAAMALPTLASCSGETPPPGNDGTADTTPTAEETTAVPEEPPLEIKDLGGMEFRILNYSPDKLTTSIFYMDAAETNSETINDAVYSRNRAIESKYKIRIAETQSTTDTHKVIADAAAASLDEYDIYMIQDTKIVNLYVAGSLAAMNDLPYVDLSKSWWNKNINEVFNLYDVQFAATGDYCLSSLTRAHVLLFNKVMLKNNDPTYDIYGKVTDYKWTMDELFTMSNKYLNDLNGDGVYDETDQYGITASMKVLYGALYNGAGERFTDIDENGDLYFPIPENERAIGILEKMYNFYSATPTFYRAAVDNGIGLAQYDIFERGQVLFMCVPLKQIDRFREMEQDIGIVPIPMYDENQKEYYTTTSSVVMTTLPATVPEERYDSIGLILEALARDSHDTVRPAYYEKVLKGRETRDSESADMVDIIFDSVSCDIGVTLWVGDTRDAYMKEVFLANTNVIASTTASIASTVAQKIADLTKQLKGN